MLRTSNNQPNPVIKHIHDEFYEVLSRALISDKSITYDNMLEKMELKTQQMVMAILRASIHNPHVVKISDHVELEIDTCPTIYLAFFTAIQKCVLTLKDLPNSLTEAEITQLTLPFTENVKMIAHNLFNTNEFKTLFSELNEFKRIQDAFYNTLAMAAATDDQLNRENMKERVSLALQNIIINTLYYSEAYQNTHLSINGDFDITDKNCPPVYRKFLEGIKNILTSYPGAFAQPNLSITDLPVQAAESIKLMSTFLMATEGFEAMYGKLSEFIFGASQIGSKTVSTPIFKPSTMRKLDRTGVTSELIRESFYSEMASLTLELVQHGVLTRDDLVGQESFIYTTLPANTILSAIIQSIDCEGIELLRGKEVTAANCPSKDNFTLFIQAILKAKNLFAKLYENESISDSELRVIKFYCNPIHSPLPEELEPYKARARECASTIIDMALEISKSSYFHGIMNTIIDNCLEIIPETDPNVSSSSSSSSFGC